MIKHCIICNLEFLTLKTKKTCSALCAKKHLSNSVKGKAGGYRAGSGRSKSGYYKGIYCGSTYELCWVIYSLDHNIKFTRFSGYLIKDNIKYFPDFLLADGKTIIETKGFEKQEYVDNKTAVAESYGYTVIVLRKDDLTYAFDYVYTAYHTKKYYELYDEYKPSYNYVCSQCSISFSKDKLLKSEQVFCSRSCAGKYRKVRRSAQLPIMINSKKRQFTKEQALEIFGRTDKSLADLAIEFNTSKNNIWNIKQKNTYKWIHV